MKFGFKFLTDIRKLETIYARFHSDVEKAGTAAIKDVENEVKLRGRANIAAAGFGKRWQNALRVDRYPKRGVSANSALWIYHRIPYADVFETGATIGGKPMLWLPLSSTPKRIGNKRMTPQLFSQSIGPLVAVHPPGKPPLLMAKYASRNREKVSLSGLRRGATRDGGNMVPVFVGVSTVNIRKRFDLRRIFREAGGKVKDHYNKHMRAN